MLPVRTRQSFKHWWQLKTDKQYKFFVVVLVDFFSPCQTDGVSFTDKVRVLNSQLNLNQSQLVSRHFSFVIVSLKRKCKAEWKMIWCQINSTKSATREEKEEDEEYKSTPILLGNCEERKWSLWISRTILIKFCPYRLASLVHETPVHLKLTWILFIISLHN